jgi:hypothetical protein
MIRCRILNFINFDFFLMVKKYRVRRFAPSLVLVLEKFPHSERFFSPYSKISRCAVNLLTSLQNINIVYNLVGGFTAHREIFTIREEKSLSERELVQDKYWARSEAANPMLFLKFKL